MSSFSNLSVTSLTSQLILQPFRRFTYVTVHSPTLPLLHLCHSSFSNPSFASPTSQALHLASRPWVKVSPFTKCRPFTLIHSWYLRANDCVSRIIAAASATRATSSSGVSILCLVHQTLHLPPDKEIHRSEIGRTWWPLYWTTPPNPTVGENIF